MNGLSDLPYLPADMSPWLALMLTLFVKGMLVLSATGILVYTLRRSSASMRYVVWSAGLLSLLALPLLSVVLPHWQVAVLPPSMVLLPAAPPAPEAAPLPVEPAAPPVVPLPPHTPHAPHAPAPHPAPAPMAEADAAGATSLLGGLRSIAAGFRLHWTVWVFLAWLAGVLVLLARLATAHAGMYLLLRRAALVEDEDWYVTAEGVARRMGIDRLVRLRWSAWTTVPLSVGVFRPLVVLPEEARTWPEERRRAVLLHEMAHVKRRDCLTHLLAQLTCALYWFNPLAWVAVRQLRVERERACDDMVLVAGTRPSAYAETLLEAARSLQSAEWSSLAAVAMARRSQLEGRLLAVLDPHLRRERLSRASSALAAVLVASIVLPLAALHPAQAVEAAPEAALLLPAPEPASPDTILVRPRGRASASVADLVGDLNVDPDVDWEVDIDPDMNTDWGVDIDPDVDTDWDVDPDVDIDTDWEFDVHVNPNLNYNDHNTWNDAIDLGADVLVDTLTIEQLIQLRKHGIDADFIRALKAMGFERLTVGELIALARYGADPEYIQAMQAAGFTGLQPEAYARMAKYGLDVDFVQAVRQAGLTNLSTDDLVALSKYGVDADYVKEIREAGLRDVSVEQLIEMRKHGVDADFIRSIRENN